MEPHFIYPSTSCRPAGSLVDSSTSELSSPSESGRQLKSEAALGAGTFRKIRIVSPQELDVTQKSPEDRDEDIFYFVARGKDREGEFNPWAIETICEIDYKLCENHGYNHFCDLLSADFPEDVQAYQPIAELLFNHREDCVKAQADSCCVMTSHDYWDVTKTHYGIHRTRCWYKFHCEGCNYEKTYIEDECYRECLELQYAENFFGKFFAIMNGSIKYDVKINGVKNVLVQNREACWQTLVASLDTCYADLSIDLNDVEGLAERAGESLFCSDDLDRYSDDDERDFYFLNAGQCDGDLAPFVIEEVKKKHPGTFDWYDQEGECNFLVELSCLSLEDYQPVAKLIYEHQSYCSENDECSGCVLTVPKSWSVTVANYGVYRTSSYETYDCKECGLEDFKVDYQRFDRLVKLEYAEKCINSIGEIIYFSHKTDEEKVNFINGLIKWGEKISWQQLAEQCQLLQDLHVQQEEVRQPVRAPLSETTEVALSSEHGADTASEEAAPPVKRLKLSPR